MEMVFIVERFGVYQRVVVGIFSSFEKAHLAMVIAKNNEPDDYHRFEIDELPIDKILNNFDKPTAKYGVK